MPTKRKNRFNHWPTMADLPPSQSDIPRLLDQILELIEAGNYAQAVPVLETVLAIDPTYPFALLNLGFCQTQLGHYAAAEENLAHAQSLLPNQAQPLYYLSRLYSRQDRLEEALAQIERATQVQPSFDEAWFERAYLLDLLGRDADAEEAYSLYLQRDPSDPFSLMNRGRKRMALGKASAASQDFTASVKADPTLQKAWFYLGECLVSMGQIEEALPAYDKAIQLAKRDPFSLIGRGTCYKELGQYAKGLADLNKAVSLAPGNPTALHYRAQIRMLQGKYQLALKDLDAAAALIPDDYLILYDSGTCLRRLVMYKKAVEVWQKMEALYPGDTYVLMGLSDTYDAMRLPQLADEVNTRAIDAGPSNMRPYTKRGYYRFTQGDHEGARQDYETALARDPAYPITYNNYVVLLFAQKKYAEALTLLERAQQVRPDMEYTCYNYACYYAIHGQPSLALDWLEKAFRAMPALRQDAKTDPDLDNLRDLERFKELMIVD